MNITLAWAQRIRPESQRPIWGSIAAAALLLMANTAALAGDEPGGDQSLEQLRNLSIEDLGNVEITSVSKSPEPLSDAPAAIYVITHEQIMRSGKRTIPEILRMAPNLQVAQVSASSYAITARGFNGTTTSNGAGNKLLVLIDGRSVYTPLYAGVFWDLQYVLSEDIDRIEVISGPGAALWGANAVNGVINIITRNSADTQGGMARVDAGNLDLGASGQYGGRIDDETTMRVYGSASGRKHDVTHTGASAHDAWRKYQGGFRLDWAPQDALLTFQGDVFHGSEDLRAPPAVEIDGQNLLARWSQTLSGTSSLQIQGYYDYNSIQVPGSLGDSLHTFDLDVQHSFVWGASQDFVWGGGFRYWADKFTNTASIKFLPPATDHQLIDAFMQDTISLTDSFKLILGTKFEDDPFVGWQFLPSARVSWKATQSDLLWASVSRAVRAPSLWDRDLNELFGTFTVLSGGHFQSETLIAYEAGYRSQPLSNLSFSISTYYNVYDDLRSIEFSPGPAFPLVYANMMKGNAYGAELWGTYDVNDWWQLQLGANFEHKDLHFKPGSSKLLGTAQAGDDPPYQLSLHSSMDLPHDLKLDITLRDVGKLPAPAVPSYFEADARLAWNVLDNLELSVAGSNLLHNHHAEYAAGGGANEIPRSVMASARWTF